MKRERRIDQHDTSVGQQKNLSPQQESNPWLPERQVGALSTEFWELVESKAIELSSYVTGILHTARISTAEVIISSDQRTILIHLSLLRNSVKWCCSPWVTVAQWIEPPPSI